MSQSEKSAYYKVLKEAGATFTKHYREYTTEELEVAYNRLISERPELALDKQQPAQVEGPPPAASGPSPTQPPPSMGVTSPAPIDTPDPNEMPGQRLNSKEEWEPIRTDSAGRVWYQEEVRKSATAKPRARRVLQYMERGVRTQQVKGPDGSIESFEIAGELPSRPAEVKITLPSYQVGIYKDPRYPFKVHVYNNRQGFDLFEVEEFYGGPEQVPPDVKRVYVENVLCYDIRTVVRAIQKEHRDLQLTGRITAR